jgi:hypothetical protein
MLLTSRLSILLTSAWLAASPVMSQQGTGAPGGDDARTRGQRLVRQMIASSGGMERWNSVRDSTFVLRTVLYDVSDKPFVTRQAFSITKDPRPMIRVDVRQLGNVHTKVWNGVESWMAVDGEPIERDKGMMSRIRESAKGIYFWFGFPFLLMDPSVEVEHLGVERLFGAELEVLQVTFKDTRITTFANDIYRYYVNPATHLVVKEDYYMRGNTERPMEFFWGDYRSVAGFVVPHVRELVSTRTERRFQRLELKELRFGVGLTEDLFRKPEPPTTAGE